MLSRLHVRNFALIDQVELEFRPGFNVLTGETGAGKSILIDALTAALGERTSSELVRAGEERALIEVAFEVGDAAGPLGEWAEDGALILSREIGANGRSVARLNGRLSTAAALREAARQLIDIHGQHDHQSLLHPERHAEFLDAWAGAAAHRARAAAAEAHAARRAAADALEELRRDERERAQRLDLFRFQIEEIDAARLEPGEEAELLGERSRLANAEKLAAAAGEALQRLADAETNAEDLLGQAAREIGALTEVDADLQPVAENLETALAAAQEAASALRGYQERIEFNPERLEEVQERLEALRQLKRKYGDTVAEILAHRERAAAELGDLEHGEERAAELEAEVAAQGEALDRAAAELHALRLAAAERLAGEVRAHLADLAMERTRFLARVEAPRPAAEEPAGGLNALLGRVEFLISPNPGEPERSLARTASGGELSRLMLALKSAMAGASPVPTLIFDEIDSGVGGHTATVLGQKLRALAGGNQILCVTHLPAVASAAETHLRVTKRQRGERTVVEVVPLEGEARLAELARMLGGAETTAREHARQLLGAVGSGG